MPDEVVGDGCEGGKQDEGEADAKDEALRKEELVIFFAERGHKKGKDHGHGSKCQKELPELVMCLPARTCRREATYSRAVLVIQVANNQCRTEHAEDVEGAEPGDVGFGLVGKEAFRVVFLEDTEGIYEADGAEHAAEHSDENEDGSRAGKI